MHTLKLTSPKVFISLRCPTHRKSVLTCTRSGLFNFRLLFSPCKLFKNCLTNQRFSGRFKFMIVYKKKKVYSSTFILSQDYDAFFQKSCQLHVGTYTRLLLQNSFHKSFLFLFSVYLVFVGLSYQFTSVLDERNFRTLFLFYFFYFQFCWSKLNDSAYYS